MTDTTTQNALTAEASPKPASAPSDLRHLAMSMPPEQQATVLAAYKASRDNFRSWLLGQLVEGVHFGFPPGTLPKFNEDGDIMQWKKGKDGQKGSYEVVPKSSWRAKPSLYKAGADFLCDLMHARDAYEADLGTWQQLGSKAGVFVYACRLVSKTTGEQLGEGRGAFVCGGKGMYENAAIKMAMKSAKCSAVINAWGLSDLFTTDLEDLPQKPDPHENPDADPSAPNVPPREKRNLASAVSAMFGKWKLANPAKAADKQALEDWVCGIIGRDPGQFNPFRPENWTFDDVDKCNAELPE